MELRIDPEFHALTPPLKEDEYAGLKQSMVNEGCRDALVTWVDPEEGETLLDGHNRYEICTKLKIPFRTIIIELPNRTAAMDWIDANQLGRRNLTPDQMSLIRGRLYNRRKKSKSEAGSKGGSSKGQNDTCLSSTAEVLSKQFGVSESTIKRDGKIAEALAKSPEDEKSVLKGEKKLKEIRRETQKKERAAKPKPTLPEGEYDVIYCDPPWKYDFSETASREIENKYPTMELDELKALEPPAANNSVIFMWATAPKLIEALELLKSWGFIYKTHAIWDKEVVGMGYWFRGQHELLLVGTKGSFSPPAEELRIGSVIREKRTQHSKKPEVIYMLLDKMFPKSTKIELFARAKHNSWASWGDEID